LTEAIKRRFDTKVFIPLLKWLDNFIGATLLSACEKMVKNVDVDEVIKDVQDKITMTDTRKWRTLQTAFSAEFRGAYQKLDLFKCFYGNFLLPSIEELENPIEELRKLAFELVRTFMIDEMKSLFKSSEGTGTRASHAEGVSDAVKTLVQNVVEDCISSDGSQSQTLEEALSLLKPKALGLLTKNRKSLRAILDEAQVESLRQNLLTKNDTEKDERRKDGKYLVEFYKNRVSGKAKQVIDGARKNFSNKIEENSRSLLQELKCRFLERRGKKKGMPVLFKFWRACFKRVADLDALWPSHPLEVRSGINDTWNSFQCANKGRSVTTAEWKAAQRLLMVAKKAGEGEEEGQWWEIGNQVEVLSEGDWWQAVILDTRTQPGPGQMEIYLAYIGPGATEDENMWLPTSR